LRASVLPWVLGALVLRALIPAGFMPMPGATLAAAMCTTVGTPGELIEIPGTAGEMQCDYCVAPTFDTPSNCIEVFSTERGAGPASRIHESPAHRFALARAQTARAPPA
jgi:hypothetical protein